MLDLKKERDRDFMARCREIMARPGRIDLAQVAREAELTGCRSYYVTHAYALRKIRELRRYPARVSAGRRGALWAEIAAGVDRLVAARGLTDSDALTFVLARGRASRFFMAEATATRLLCDMVNRSRRHRRRPMSGTQPQPVAAD